MEMIDQVFLDLAAWKVERVLHGSGHKWSWKPSVWCSWWSMCFLRISHGGLFPWREVIFNNKGFNDKHRQDNNNWKEMFSLEPITDVRLMRDAPQCDYKC